MTETIVILDELPDDADELKLAYRELEARNHQLSDEVANKDKDLAAYNGLASVLKELLEAEKRADELQQHKGGCDEAYEIYHALRDATARIHKMVHPAVRMRMRV